MSDPDEKSICIPISIFVNERAQIIDTFALVNSRTTSDFINQDLAKKRGYQLQRLFQLLKAQNVDRSANQGGVICHKVTLHLWIAKTEEKRVFLVVNCGQEKLILGLPWLWEVNLLIDWTMGEVTISFIPRIPWHDSPAAITQWYLIHYLGMDPDHKIAHLWKKRMDRYAKEAYLIRKTALATELAQQMEKPKAELPQSYVDFRDIFEKKTIDKLPPSRTFDHDIELNEGFSPKVAKVYLLNPKEQEACRAFVDEHLKSRKIIPSKSSQALPFFFVPKKDGSIRPCQDYQYLNSHIVKNTYPLPLIFDLIDKLKGSSIFTKMDIRWGYNNVLIKPEDR